MGRREKGSEAGGRETHANTKKERDKLRDQGASKRETQKKRGAERDEGERMTVKGTCYRRTEYEWLAEGMREKERGQGQHKGFWHVQREEGRSV